MAAQAHRALDTFLPTKIFTPRQHPDLLARRALSQAIQDGLWRPLTVIQAPAGYGKTTLVSQWLADSDRPIAWLSLDESDNEPVRFLAYLLAALQRIRPDAIAGLDLTALPASEVALEPLLAQLLIVPLAETSQPLVLVLDDFHALTNPRVIGAVDWLVDNLPTCLHILITTRVAPDLSMANRRARDEVTELDARALSFSADEVAGLMARRLREPLAPEALSSLYQRTEGWPAGLQLVSLALKRGGAIDDVLQTISKEGDAAAFLIREVLDRLTPELRSFLLQTSVLDRFDASLAAAVTALAAQDSAATRHLTEAHQGGLFLVPLDFRGRWFRFHHLFGETLRALLAEESPVSAAELCRRASQWWLEQSNPRAAATYAIRARDYELLERIVEDWGFEMIKISDRPSLRHWLDHLPMAIFETSPVASICAGWLDVLPIRAMPARASALAAVARARRALSARGMTSGERFVELDAHMQAIESIATRPAGELAASEAHANQTLGQLDRRAPIPRSVLALQVGVLRVMMGQLNEALAPLQAAEDDAMVGGNLHAAMAAVGYRSWALRILGRLDEARQQCAIGQRELEAQGAAWLGMSAHLHLELAHLHFEAWELPESLSALEEALPRARILEDPFLLVSCLALQARVYDTAGEPELADLALAELEVLAAQDGHPVLLLWARAAKALLAAARGDGSSSAADPDRVVASYTSVAHAMALATVRACIVSGALELALDISERLAGIAERQGWISHQLDWQVESAVILGRLGRSDAFRTALDGAVARSGATGLRRALGERRHALADEAPHAMRTVFSESALVAPSADSPATRPASPQERLVPRDVVMEGSSEAPLETPLSPRECEVLRWVDKGLSNPEIASALFVSPGTIKTHMHRILRKLGVKNRLQATQKARRYGLLGRVPEPASA